MDTHQPPAPGSLAELRGGALVLVGCVVGVATCAAAAVYTAGVFVKPVIAAFGWSRGQISLGHTLVTGMMALCSPVVGHLIDRRGEWPFIIFSAICTALVYYSFSHLNGDVRMFWLGSIAMGVLGGGTSPLVYSRLVSARFDKARGTALAIALMGAGLNSMFGPGIIGAVVAAHGWRTGYVTLAMATAIALPVVLVCLSGGGVMRTPPTRQEKFRASRPEFIAAMRTRTFWLLIAAFFLMMAATGGMLLHFVALLTDRGLTPQRAAVFAGLIGLSLIVARLVTGVLVDRFFAPRVAAGIVLLCAICLAALSAGGALAAPLGAIGLGLSVGAELDLAPFMTARYFSKAIYGRVYGIMYGVFLLGSMSSTLVYGYGFDAWHSYVPMLVAAACCMLLACGAFLLLPRYPELAAVEPDETIGAEMVQAL